MRKAWIGIIVLLLAGVGGCQWRHRYVTDARMTKGLVIVLPGIEGRSFFNAAIREGLSDGGVDWGIEVHDWTTGAPLVLYHLFAKQRNKRMAQDVVRRICEYKLTHPDRPVVLVGQSGGAAIATWVAEAMPDGQKLTGVILIAPAISPNYLLEQALRNTERGIVNFYSRRDWVFLGVGTTIYGTMDRKHTSSAGRLGFEVPDQIWRPPEYEKLFQIAWQENMSKAGNAGGHLSSGTTRFVSTYVAPMVLAETWDQKLIAEVGSREPAPRTRPTTVPAPVAPPATATRSRPPKAKPSTPLASKPPAGVKKPVRVGKPLPVREPLPRPPAASRSPSPPSNRVRGPLPPPGRTPNKGEPVEKPTGRLRNPVRGPLPGASKTPKASESDQAEPPRERPNRVRGPLPPQARRWESGSTLPSPDQWQVEPPLDDDGHLRPQKPRAYSAVGV